MADRTFRATQVIQPDPVIQPSRRKHRYREIQIGPDPHPCLWPIPLTRCLCNLTACGIVFANLRPPFATHLLTRFTFIQSKYVIIKDTRSVDSVFGKSIPKVLKSKVILAKWNLRFEGFKWSPGKEESEECKEGGNRPWRLKEEVSSRRPPSGLASHE